MTEWLHLIWDKKASRHDVWVSEIRVKLRARDRFALLRKLGKHREKFREVRALRPTLKR